MTNRERFEKSIKLTTSKSLLFPMVLFAVFLLVGLYLSIVSWPYLNILYKIILLFFCAIFLFLIISNTISIIKLKKKELKEQDDPVAQSRISEIQEQISQPEIKTENQIKAGILRLEARRKSKYANLSFIMNYIVCFIFSVVPVLLFIIFFEDIKDFIYIFIPWSFPVIASICFAIKITFNKICLKYGEKQFSNFFTKVEEKYSGNYHTYVVTISYSYETKNLKIKQIREYMFEDYYYIVNKSKRLPIKVWKNRACVDYDEIAKQIM